MAKNEAAVSPQSTASETLRESRLAKGSHFRRYGETYITAYDTPDRPILTDEQIDRLATLLVKRSGSGEANPDTTPTSPEFES